MTKKTVLIHGKKYVPVSERIKEWHEDTKGEDKSIETEVLQYTPIIVVRATVKWNKKTFTGISAVDPAKPNGVTERSNPYEVAETSAVGRALAFAGYQIEDGIASAEEIRKSPTTSIDRSEDTDPSINSNKCPECGTTNQYHAKGCLRANK